MIYILILGLEWVAIGVVGITYIFKFMSLLTRRITIKQMALWGHGQILAFVGAIIMVGVPEYLGIQFDTSDSAGLKYVFVVAIGFSMLLIGFRLSAASYKTKEENPKWIRWIMKVWK
jgi:hypothetical protein